MRELYRRFLDAGGVVSTDSRAASGLFFALRGERFDGNKYAAGALEAGARYAVVDDSSVAVDDRYIVVPDALTALQELAAHHRREIGITILAITGTNGKTTTKELVARVLAVGGLKVVATAGNLNNHIGVPLTLLGMGKNDFGVVEMGASAVGEIARLCEIAAPNFGLITNIGRAHLDGFGGFEGVRKAKGELYEYLSAHGGTAFIRRGDEVLTAMMPPLSILYDEVDYPSALVGAYNIYNVSAAAAVGAHFGVSEADVRAAIASYIPTNNRSQRVEAGDNTLILDCYNANPSSMRAALDDFRGDTVILGDMAELGSYAAAEHAEIVSLLGAYDVYLVGEHFTEAAAKGMKTFPDVASLVAFLHDHPLNNRTILIKGSRSIGLEKILSL